MKLKTVEVEGQTYAAIQDGKPIYLKDDGSEVPFDAAGTVQTISRLNGEAKGHREAKEAAETALKAFEGIDAAQAKDALEKIANIDTKKLIDAGEKDAAIEAAIKPFKDQLAEKDEAINKLSGTLNKEMIGGAFSRSKFVDEKLAIPADLVEARFGQNFKLENDQVVAYDGNGNKIYSPSSPGELAKFDEALEVLVNSYVNKDHILKGAGSSGGGAKTGADGAGGSKTITRANFDKLPPVEQRSKVNDGFKVVDAA